MLFINNEEERERKGMKRFNRLKYCNDRAFISLKVLEGSGDMAMAYVRIWLIASEFF